MTTPSLTRVEAIRRLQNAEPEIRGLGDLLEDRLGRRVEVVTIEALSPFLGPRILAEAEDVLRAA